MAELNSAVKAHILQSLMYSLPLKSIFADFCNVIIAYLIYLSSLKDGHIFSSVLATFSQSCNQTIFKKHLRGGATNFGSSFRVQPIMGWGRVMAIGVSYRCDGNVMRLLAHLLMD